MLSTRIKAGGYCGIDLTCELVSTQVDGEDELGYTTYGVSIKNRDGEEIVRYTDISTEKRIVEEFIGMCDGCGASAVHVGEILEDFMQ